MLHEHVQLQKAFMNFNMRYNLLCTCMNSIYSNAYTCVSVYNKYHMYSYSLRNSPIKESKLMNDWDP